MRYSLGLDIGTSSIGWAVIDLDNNRIHDLGVRIFERPEDPQNGDSLAKPRRDARSARRRLKRRRQRLDYLKDFFVSNRLLSRELVDEVLSPVSRYNALDVYALRTKALNEALTAEELLKVLYQISKRRGFKSNRKVDEESDKEGGRVTKALTSNKQFLADNSYETVGVALDKDEKFAVHKRNKRDDYRNSFARADFEAELRMILESQKPYALSGISDETIDSLVGINTLGDTINTRGIFYQRPFMTEALIEKMVGECTFEKGEKRAPRASYSFEIFRLASDLANLVYIPKDSKPRDAKKDNLTITLTPEQIQTVIQEAKRVKALDYGKVRKIAGIGEEYVSQYIRGKISEDDPYGEKNNFGSLEAYHAIKAAFKDLPEDWKQIDSEDTLNAIAYILTTQRSDDNIAKELGQLNISEPAKTALLSVKTARFKTFGHLSIEALKNITPHIIAGLSYDKACDAAGYDFKKKSANLEQITNPVVKRAVSQTGKVVRAIERKYGKPYTIHVETARDMAKDFKDRKAIEHENKENQAYNTDIKQIIELGYEAKPATKAGELLLSQLREFSVPLSKNIDFNGQQITKIKLYREQQGKCLYSGVKIDFEQMLHDDNAYQIDHIVPFSRSNNDGMTNKVLVSTTENQKKSNRTPFEYFGGDEGRWKSYASLVEATYKTRDVKTSDKAANQTNYKFNGYAMRKKQNLLLEEYKNDSWNIRALNDTRYITRFVQNYLRQTVDFAESDNERRQKVFTPNGTITSYLRKRWGLRKSREDDVLHHAADAAIVAAINPSVILRANLFAKKQEVSKYLSDAKTIDEKTDKLTGEILDETAFDNAQRRQAAHEVLTHKHFPQPWDDFAKEVRKRTLSVDTTTLRNELRGMTQYADEDFRSSIQPIFVSRMPQRKAAAQAHKETIRSPKVKDGDQRTVRMQIKNMKKKDVQKSTLKESDRWLYDEMLRRLEEHGDSPDKAFAEPLYKNNKTHDRNGNPLSPVSTVKVYSTQPSGFLINNDKAFVNNGSMIRLDVYQKASAKGKIEHFFVPVYAHQAKCKTPTKILPAPKGFTDVDETFTEVCSLYPNDYVRVYFGNKITEGYYVKYGSASGQMVLLSHASASKDTYITCSARSAVAIERYDISILGDNAPRT